MLHHPYHWSRLILAVSIFAAAGGIYFAARDASGVSGYSLLDLVRGRPAPEPGATTFTTRNGPLVQLKDVKLLSQMNEEYTRLIRAVIPSVVSVTTSRTVNVPRFYYNQMQGFTLRNETEARPNLGSGVLLTEEGHIITNHHVIADLGEIRVTLHNGREYEATVIGADIRGDVAVLKIDGEEGETFPCLTLGNSSEVRVGEMVFAVGNPFGLTESVTRGIISGKERRLTDADAGYFQTDTVINPGSSGGPLVNVRGEVIAINNHIYSGQEGVDTWQGVGLAIPSNDVRESFEAIMSQGRAHRGYLGIGVKEPDQHVAFGLEVDEIRGVQVTEVVPDSPAHAADLRAGDTILTFDGEPVDNTGDLVHLVRRQQVGQVVTLELKRDGQMMELTAAIGERAPEIALAATVARSGSAQQPISEILAVDVAPLDFERRERLGLPPATPAVIITSVAPNSPAKNLLRIGDLVHKINYQPIGTREQFLQSIDNLPMNRNSVLLITRNGAPAYVVFHTRAKPNSGEE